MSRADFPPTRDPVEKLFSTNYMSWWEKAHRKFLEDNLQALADNIGLKSTTPLGDEDQGVGEMLSRIKEPPTPIPKVVTQHKKRKLKSSKAALKEVLNTIGHPMVSLHDKLQVSDESIGGPTSKVKSSSKASSLPHDKVLKRQTPNGITHIPPMTNAAVSIFEGNSIVFNHKKKFILGLWEDICNRLSKTRAELLSSYWEQTIEIFKDMKETNILYLSPLESLLDSLFELAASYDQERSNMADKTSEDEKLELISKAKERLESFKPEASKKVKKVSSSEKKMKRVVKRLQILQQERENLDGVI
ncbi:hypothetical protein A4A49_37617 [Nicotiana attenuata]|uniref:Uncharacterized protein n=1 Tax=Nicotiana attenuata TaxID=49451 RepID=A0A1J6KDH0_NICAT|nr:hypothetical protein A4A49_37617 [Nicotiana attenuata]